MGQIKEIIFDCFGVLTEDSWLAFLRKYGHLVPGDSLQYANHAYDTGQIRMDDLVDEVHKLTSLDKTEIKSMISYQQQPNQAVFKVAQDLKNQGYKLGIISNVGSPLDTILPAESLEIFDEITLSYQAGVAKPDRGIFEYHLRRVGLTAEEVIFIDDRAINCKSAEQLGIKTIVFESVELLEQQLDEFLKID